MRFNREIFNNVAEYFFVTNCSGFGLLPDHGGFEMYQNNLKSFDKPDKPNSWDTALFLPK